MRSCYEAGREGFWLHRALEAKGIQNNVVDASSIEVNRRQRRAKTDRMDVEKLVRQLVRTGEENTTSGVWFACRARSQEPATAPGAGSAEGGTQATPRANSVPAVYARHRREGGGEILSETEAAAVLEPGTDSGAAGERIEPEYHRLELVEAQIREVKGKQAEQMRAAQKNAALEKVRRLQRLVSIGLGSSWIFVMELFGWREFQNRRELAAAVGLTPTPYNSGDSAREQGISRSGNRRIRKLLIEIAWAWLRLQPESKLSRWYNQRFAKAGKRMRRIGIVALARKLVIDLWATWNREPFLKERQKTSAGSSAC